MVLNLDDFHLKSYSNWKIAGIVIAVLKAIFNIYFGYYFELLLLIVHVPSVYVNVYNILIGINLVSCLSWLIGILSNKTIFMLVSLFWWTLIMSPFLWIAIFDAIYDYENYAVRINPYYTLTAFIVICYVIAVLCYRSMGKDEQKHSPKASETSEAPEMIEKFETIPPESADKGLMAYV